MENVKNLVARKCNDKQQANNDTLKPPNKQTLQVEPVTDKIVNNMSNLGFWDVYTTRFHILPSLYLIANKLGLARFS